MKQMLNPWTGLFVDLTPELRDFLCGMPQGHFMHYDHEPDQEARNLMLEFANGFCSPEEFNERAAQLEPDSTPFEGTLQQRRYIENVRARVRRLFPIATFPNKRDWQTRCDIEASKEIAMSFCDVKDPQGQQLGSDVDRQAQRCLDSESGSRKQSEMIEQLEDENSQLREKLISGGPGRGNKTHG